MTAIVEEIVDVDDPRVAAFRLNERQLNPRSARRESVPSGMFVAEGDLVVERAMTAGCRPVALLASPARAEAARAEMPDHVSVLVATDDVRRVVTGLGVPLDIVGLFERPTPPETEDVLASARRVVVLDQVDNPTNVGAIVRSAAALGADALLLDRTSADPLTRRALRVSMGTAFTMLTARVHDAREALTLLDRAGFASVALTPAPEADPIGEIASALGRDSRVALVLGAERTGLDSDTQIACTHRARIPMHADVDSLNVAAAAAVAAYALFSG